MKQDRMLTPCQGMEQRGVTFTVMGGKRLIDIPHHRAGFLCRCKTLRQQRFRIAEGVIAVKLPASHFVIREPVRRRMIALGRGTQIEDRPNAKRKEVIHSSRRQSLE